MWFWCGSGVVLVWFWCYRACLGAAADLPVLLLLLQPVQPLQPQLVQLQPQLLGLRADAGPAHHHLQDLQHPNHFGHEPGQSLAAVLVYDPLELLAHHRGDVVHVHHREVGHILLQGRPGVLHVGIVRPSPVSYYVSSAAANFLPPEEQSC